jgi:hypothetical protein
MDEMMHGEEHQFFGYHSSPSSHTRGIFGYEGRRSGGRESGELLMQTIKPTFLAPMDKYQEREKPERDSYYEGDLHEPER